MRLMIEVTERVVAMAVREHRTVRQQVEYLVDRGLRAVEQGERGARAQPGRATPKRAAPRRAPRKKAT